MRLNVETTGNGPSLVMLHGWGANNGVWAGVRKELARYFTLHLFDLPGHGQSEFSINVMRDMSSLAAEIAGYIDEPALWLGWSLGGMAALAAAQNNPDKVKALVTVASSPRFLKSDDWPHAVELFVLSEFAGQVQGNTRKALQRFIALQTRGSDTQRDDARVLRESLLEDNMPNQEALAAGLDLLRDTDLRAGLTDIRCPVMVVAGERDTLQPLASMQETAAAIPGARLKVIAGAGHAPFISHRTIFLETLLSFLQQQVGMSRVV